jgi:hypothetical protein
MRMFRSARLWLLALLVSLIPASSYAGVFISVGFAPPVLPVYEQPPCPEPGLIWTPGYWAYGPDGYYWVPGAWVPAPYEGALWTPPYWGWSDGLYVWHPGYWGRHVGYYGGVNYGFGYMGVGFVGGVWHGSVFAYNTAVVHVNTTIIHNTYIDRTVVEHNTIVNDRRVAFSGGPGGIRHDPLPEERMAEHEQHLERTSFQTQHADMAMHDHAAYFKNNGGRPNNVAMARPLQGENHPAPENRTVINNNVTNNYNNRSVTENRNNDVHNYNHTTNNDFNRSNNTNNNFGRQNNNFERQNNNNNFNRPAPQEHNAPRSQEHSNPRPEGGHEGEHEGGHGHDEGHGHGR